MPRKVSRAVAGTLTHVRVRDGHRVRPRNARTISWPDACRCLCAALCLALVALLPPAARAQSDAPVGVRAAGMGGAFVAVADDASAVYWNPAGFASGSFFSLVIDRNQMNTADDVGFPREGSGLLVALGTPPLGLAYYRTTLTRRVTVGSSTPQVENLVTASPRRHAGAVDRGRARGRRDAQTSWRCCRDTGSPRPGAGSDRRR